METVFRRQIMPHVQLTCVETDKFKTGVLSVYLLTKLKKEDAAKNALLPQVLRRGTARHPDMESMAAALDELYGAYIEPVVQKKGELQCIGFYSSFIDDRYVPQGGNILYQAAALLGEVLLTPNTRGGRLKAEYVEGEKEKLIEEIQAAVNDKRQYSVNRLVEQMCAEEAFGINRLGTEEAVKKITVASLTKHYKKLLASAAVEIFYCGSEKPEKVQQAVLSAFGSMPRGEFGEDLTTEVRAEPVEETPRLFTETLNVTQGKLALGFRLGPLKTVYEIAAAIVFNAVYGGAVTSKLFLNVREKLSLCYFANSALEKQKGIMLVSSGIEFSKYQQALDEILAQLEAVKSGKIESWELESAKRAVVTSLKTTEDRPAMLAGFYLEQAVAGLSCTPEEIAALAEGVTAEEVRKIASAVKLDAIYFLKGEGTNEDERI